MPVWFLAHGSPLHLLGEQPVRQCWQQLPQRLPTRPRAILCLSAHWLTESPSLCGQSPAPGIQHDFFGFPDALYQIRWTLRDDPATDQWLSGQLDALLPVSKPQPERALDHGCWVPLMNAWPQPDFPVYQLSLCPQKGAQWHLELGNALSALRKQGVLIIGSGGIVHNLQRLDWQAERDAAQDWASEFMEAFESAFEQRDYEALCNPWSLPQGRLAVPTIEHYLPLLVALGCARGEAVQPLYRGWDYGSLAMHSYQICGEMQV